MATIVCYVNGYGATDNLDDGNYNRYLSGVVAHLRHMHPHDDVVLYLSGGYTNRTDLTEAESMRRILEHRGIVSSTNLTVICLETAFTARQGIRAFHNQVGDDARAIIFCECSRRWTMKFFACQLFTHPTVVGIPFDRSSMRLTHRLKQLFFRLPLEIGAWHSPLVDRLRKKLRNQHVARARARSTAER